MLAKEIERAGIPTVQICSMTQVAATIGAPRIVTGVSVLHPTGNPALDPEAEHATRRTVVVEALKTMTSSQ